MTAHKLNLAQLAMTYTFLHTELMECPELMQDDEFMERYNRFEKEYRHYYHQAKQRSYINFDKIREASDGGVL